MDGKVTIDGVDYCNSYLTGYSMTASVTIGDAPASSEDPVDTEPVETEDPNCVDNADWTNNRGLNCDDMYQKYIQQGKDECSNQVRNNCCAMCSMLGTLFLHFF